jgi:methylated-DNA-[protein]-cysteine S-methyltransferase
MPQIYYTYLNSPIGQLLLTMEDDHLTNVCMHKQKREIEIDPDWKFSAQPFRLVAKQLAEYFDGKRIDFEVPLRLRGTEFQLSVWAALKTIPYGTTMSYGALAKQINNPKAVRAVGLANGQNPIPIIIPCHRVIGANGSLTGFGGGLANKKILLDLEQTSLVSRLQPETQVGVPASAGINLSKKPQTTHLTIAH